MLSGIKRMMVNLVKENKKLFYIIGGAVALPLALAITIGLVFAVGSFFLLLGLDVYQAITLMILMILGAIGGLIAYNNFGE
jgi:hypothetical protein